MYQSVFSGMSLYYSIKKTYRIGTKFVDFYYIFITLLLKYSCCFFFFLKISKCKIKCHRKIKGGMIIKIKFLSFIILETSSTVIIFFIYAFWSNTLI